MRKVFMGIVLLLVTGMTCAEMVMQVDLNGELDKVKLSTISKIVFDGNSMIAGATYNLDNVSKITFYDDNISPIIKADTKDMEQQKVGFTLNASNLALTLTEASDITVRIFSINGRQIAELHKGKVQAGIVDMSLQNLHLASGVYSVVVQANNQLFVKKMVLK